MSLETDQLRRSWDANAQTWCSVVRGGQIESRRTVTDAAIIAAVMEAQPATALDVGCGEGWLARELGSRGVAVTGFDGSASLIDAARDAGGGTFLVRSYDDVIADAEAVPGVFDAVIANFSLLDDQVGELLHALRSKLSARGRLIIQTVHPLMAAEPYADGWRTETFAEMPGTWRESMPWYFRTLGSWWRMLEDAGYGRISIREPMHSGKAKPASLIFTTMVI